MNFSKYKSDVILVIHLLLGITAGFFPAIVFYWVFLVFLIGLYFGLAKSSTTPAYLFASYLTGVELLGRMSSSGLPHEFIKYAITVMLLASLMFQRKEIPYLFVFFFLLLIPSAFLTDGGDFEETRQLISGNLSGPLCLVVSVIYFYNRPLDGHALRKTFLYLLYPLASIVGYLIVRTPDFNEIEFGFQSNFATSIYGPNQMSSVLGLGILIIGFAYLIRVTLFGSYILTLSFLGILLFRGLLTFSRGGMITAAILLVVIFFYLAWKVGGFNKYTTRIIIITAVVGIAAVMAFDYTNRLTDNALYGRYTGIKNGKQVEDIDKLTSGRTIIIYLDWQIFKDNMLMGIGPGMGKYDRVKYGYNVQVAAHNEFSRILAEHGLLGVIALAILILAPFQHFLFSRKIIERVFIIAFIGFCFIFMTHAATRIAAPCFLYGLAFIRIVSPSQRLQKYGFVHRQHAVKKRQNSFSY